MIKINSAARLAARSKRQHILFWRLSRNADERRPGHRASIRAHRRGAGGQLQRTQPSQPATAARPLPAFNTCVNGAVTPEVVQGAGLAQQLQNSLEYPVFSGEPFYQPGCTSATCVFPGAVIPKSAWTVPSQNLLNYIPMPNDGPSTFVGQSPENLRDDKWSYTRGWKQRALGEPLGVLLF
jgi:hypothetical protein